jgi:hypothetical protein
MSKMNTPRSALLPLVAPLQGLNNGGIRDHVAREMNMQEKILAVAAMLVLGACTGPASTGQLVQTPSRPGEIIGGAANPWQGTQSWDQWYWDHPTGWGRGR